MGESTRRVFLGALAGSLAAASSTVPALAQAATVRASGTNVADLFSEPFYAKMSGSFTKAGLEIEPITVPNGAAMSAAIAGGSIDIGMGDLVSGVNAILAGVPMVLFAAGGLYRMPEDGPSLILAVNAASPVRTARDLIGKTVAVPTLIGLATAAFRTWLAGQQVGETQVKMVEMPPPAAAAALQRGTIDATMLSEPFVTAFKGSVRAIASPYDVIASRTPQKRFAASVWYAAKSWVDADRARARKVAAAIYDAARWANANRAQTLEFLMNTARLDAAKFASMNRVEFATSLSPDMIQPALTIAGNLKMYAKPVTASDLIVTI